MIVEQRSSEWFEMRKGKITSSEIHKIMGERGLGETGKTYLLEKVVESYDGFTEPATGKALDWGVELEPVALEHYEQLRNVKVSKASFIPADKHYGGSPDGLLPPDGIVEVKCPYKSTNHFKHGLIKDAATFKKLKPEYYYQCMSNMICTGTEWCDFISFDPRVKKGFEMFIFRLKLDQEEADRIKERVRLAVAYMVELEAEIETARIC